MSKKRQSLIEGALILSFTGILVKLIGMVYRIPLANLIGDEGMGLYQKAYPVYSWLLVISSAGMPNAIAKLVSEKVSKNDYIGANRIHKVALIFLIITGTITSLIMFFVAERFAIMTGDPRASYAIMCISPAVFFVAIFSAYRGYFQGLRRMTPTAISQLIEQTIKLLAGLYIAYKLMPKGVEWGAAGALIGVSLSEVASWVFLKLKFSFHIFELKKKNELTNPYIHKEPAFRVLKNLLSMCIPIMIGSSIMPLVNTIDTVIVTNSLISIGYTAKVSTSLFGLLTGYANTLVNMPTVISLALCMSLVPAIASNNVLGNKKAMNNNISLALKFSILVGLPSAVGLMLLAKPILDLLYNLPNEKLVIASKLLIELSPAVLFLSIVQTLNGILQGIGKVFVPVISLLSGAILKIILNVILISNPTYNIYGAPIGTVVCYGVSAIINIIIVCKLTGVKFGINEYIITPLISTLSMAISVLIISMLLTPKLSGNISTIISILGASIVYIIMLLKTKCVSERELSILPAGKKIIFIARKIKIL